MSTSGQELIDEAVAELRRKQKGLLATRRKLAETSTKVTSKDGMVTVLLDARGEVKSITFNSPKFRRIAPAELGSILVETIGQARTESREHVLRAYQSFLPDSLDVRGVMAGRTDLNEMFEDALRQADEMMTRGKPSSGKSHSAKEGSRNGSQHR